MITNIEVFVNLFRNLKSDWSVVPGPLCFMIILSIKRDWDQKKK